MINISITHHYLLNALNITKTILFSTFPTSQLGSLRTILTAAVQKAFPQVISEEFGVGIITRCGNPAFGDFQCNNSLSIAKYFKTLSGFSGKNRNNFDAIIFLSSHFFAFVSFVLIVTMSRNHHITFNPISFLPNFRQCCVSHTSLGYDYHI